MIPKTTLQVPNLNMIQVTTQGSASNFQSPIVEKGCEDPHTIIMLSEKDEEPRRMRSQDWRMMESQCGEFVRTIFRGNAWV